MTALSVIASGMVTPLGFNAPASLAALRAGVTAVRQTPWQDFESGEPLRGAKVALPQWWEGLGKLADLLAPAVHECLQAVQAKDWEAVPLLVGVADKERPGRTAGLEEHLLAAVEERLGLRPHSQSAVFPTSQTGCALALMEADRLLQSGQVQLCIVAGVDSFLHQATLDAYIARRRLITPSNSNGFFPGEAACAVLLAKASAAGAHAGLDIIGWGVAQEPATIDSTVPLKGVGLTQAVRQALAASGVALADVSFRLTDLSGEHYKFKEALFVLSRLDRGPRERILRLWHPIEYTAEIGAAILPCLLAWALHAQQNGYAPGPLALCHVGNDAGQRAAVVVRGIDSRRKT